MAANLPTITHLMGWNPFWSTGHGLPRFIEPETAFPARIPDLSGFILYWYAFWFNDVILLNAKATRIF
jgi:hypothetical protein